jgi:hypothetical protein
VPFLNSTYSTMYIFLVRFHYVYLKIHKCFIKVIFINILFYLFYLYILLMFLYEKLSIFDFRGWFSFAWELSTFEFVTFSSPIMWIGSCKRHFDVKVKQSLSRCFLSILTVSSKHGEDPLFIVRDNKQLVIAIFTMLIL